MERKVAVTEWEPATEAEAAMRDALRANDQERYFRILARTELLLPVSAHALAGHAPMGWGTWTTSGRTHVLAFTSVNALQACLGDNAGSTRRTAYHELAGNWPNLEWWLAVNPGLPVEGYLPAWFVSQLARGDVRLPGRTIGARARMERAETAARARATAAVPSRAVPHEQAPELPPAAPAPTQALPVRQPPTPVVAPTAEPTFTGTSAGYDHNAPGNGYGAAGSDGPTDYFVSSRRVPIAPIASVTQELSGWYADSREVGRPGRPAGVRDLVAGRDRRGPRTGRQRRRDHGRPGADHPGRRRSDAGRSTPGRAGTRPADHRSIRHRSTATGAVRRHGVDLRRD